MKNHLLLLFVLLVISSGCCPTYPGYGRYKMKTDCQKVVIDNVEYNLTLDNNSSDLMIDGHSIIRGIYRKTRPWLYIHEINRANNTIEIDVTFESGLKKKYPLYTGNKSSSSINYSQLTKLEESTCISLQNNYWLVAHRFTENGVFFDLQRDLDSQTNTSWNLVQEDIFVNRNGINVNIPLISTSIKLTSFNFEEKVAIAEFNQL